jgi:hypothetical protein
MSEISSFEDLEREIERTKEEFYSATAKNMFFKKQQKFDCAKQIVDKIHLDVLLNRTCYIIENTNLVHIDYPTLKIFASPEIFDTISDFIIKKIAHAKSKYDEIEVALNFDSFTVSAAERYRDLIRVFCQHCFQRNTNFAVVITRFVIYNCPNVIDNIKQIVLPFMDENLKPKMVLAAKKDSEQFRAFYSQFDVGSIEIA